MYGFIKKNVFFLNLEHDDKVINCSKMSDEKDKNSSPKKNGSKEKQKEEKEEDIKNKLPRPPPNRHSILKRQSNLPASSTGKPGDQRQFRFNEENIKETYHPEGKDYGNMPIDEPPTPKPKKGEPVDPNALNKKLVDLEKKQKETEEAEERRSQFEQKRKKHYEEGSHMHDEKKDENK